MGETLRMELDELQKKRANEEARWYKKIRFWNSSERRRRMGLLKEIGYYDPTSSEELDKSSEDLDRYLDAGQIKLDLDMPMPIPPSTLPPVPVVPVVPLP